MNCPFTKFLACVSLLIFSNRIEAQVYTSPDYAQTTVNQPVVIDVLSNDSPAALLPGQIVLTDNCTATFNAQGKLSVIPNRDFVGVALVNYTGCTDKSHTNCATELVTVQVNDNPTPYFDGITVYAEKNSKATFTIPRAFSFTQKIPTNNGTIAPIGDGVVNYIPKKGFAGTDYFLFYSNDNKSFFEVAFEVFALPTVNTFLSDDRVTVRPNTTAKIKILDNDKLDNVAPSAISNIAFSGFVNGEISGIADGYVSFVPTAGFSGIASFKYTLVNKDGLAETATVHITVSDFSPVKDVFELTIPANSKYAFSYDSEAAAVFNTGANSATLNGGKLEYDATKKSFLYTPPANAANADGDQITIRYCKNSTCSDYKNVTLVFHVSQVSNCAKDCVYPGDANNDGIVNMLDLFPIANNMGTYGAIRPDVNPLDWYGRNALNWADVDAATNTNLKFADANGDGIISADDTLALSVNYTQTSKLVPPTYIEGSTVSLELLTPVGNVRPGDIVEIALNVGSIEQPAYSTKGLAFSVNYDSKRIKENSITVDFNSYSWLSRNNAYLNMSKVVQRGVVDAALVRSRNSGSTGHGEIGKIRGVVIEDIQGISQGNKPTLRFTVSDMYVQNENGTATLIKGATIDIPIVPRDKTASLSNSDLKVYPNPANTVANFYLNGENTLKAVRLVDISGRTIQIYNNINSKQFSIPLTGVTSGLYIIDAQTEKGRITQKLQVTE